MKSFLLGFIAFFAFGSAVLGQDVAMEVTCERQSCLLWEPFALRIRVVLSGVRERIKLTAVVNGKRCKEPTILRELHDFNAIKDNYKEGSREFYVTFFGGVAPSFDDRFASKGGEYTLAIVDEVSGSSSNTVTVMVQEPGDDVSKAAIQEFSALEVVLFALNDRGEKHEAWKAKAQKIADMAPNTVYARVCRHAIAVCELDQIKKRPVLSKDDSDRQTSDLGALADRFRGDFDLSDSTIFAVEALYYRSYCLAMKKEYEESRQVLDQLLSRIGDSPAKIVVQARKLRTEIDDLLKAK